MTPVTSKKVYSDFDDSPTFAKVNEELVDQTSNKDLKPLRIRNLKKIGILILIPLGIRSIFLLIKYKETFPPDQFLLDGYSVSFRCDRDGNGGGISLFIREDIPWNLLPRNNNIEGFFVETNLRNKKEWLLSCSCNPKIAPRSNHLAEFS